MKDYKVSDYVVDRLKDWHVDRIFGYPGDAINPVVTALNRPDKPIEFIQARHEEMAAFMACAHAKFTGKLGVCLATAGPGAIHLLNGLYDAKMDHQPVLAIVGQQPRHALGTSFLQDVDLVSLFKDVAHEYVNIATTPEQVRHLIDRSIRTAQAKRTVTCLILPHDLQLMPAEAHPEREHGQSFSGTGYTSTEIVPEHGEILRAAEVLNKGNKVAILIGAGALEARREVLEVAEILGAGIAKALLGKAAVEDNLLYVTGSIGMLGTKGSCDMMESCDTLFMIGSNFPYAEYLPKPDTAKGVQIDLDPQNLSLRYPMEVGLVGDARATLRELIPYLHRKEDRGWRAAVEGFVRDSEASLAEQANVSGQPVNPQLVFAEMSDRLPEQAIITSDSGTSTVWYARYLKMRPGMMASVSGGLASMGCSIAYGVAGKLAYPGRPVVCCSGDGAMQMLGNAELITVAQRWREWADPRFVVVVLKNNDLNFVTWEMRVTEGDPKFEASQNIPDFSYANYATSLGLEGLIINSVDQIDAVLDRAFTAAKPVVIEVESDPNIPPLPPQVTIKDMKAFAHSLAKGDPEKDKPLWGALTQFWHMLSR